MCVEEGAVKVSFMLQKDQAVLKIASSGPPQRIFVIYLKSYN